MIFHLDKNTVDESPKNILRFKLFNEGFKNRRNVKKSNKTHKSGSMTDLARRLGIKIEEQLLNGDTLIESKEDQQRFIDKFGRENFDLFWNNKQRLKNKDVNVDILWHVKHTSLSDMQKILDSISDEQRMAERDYEGNPLPEPTDNYEVVFENDDYTVYHPHDYVSSVYCAKGGRWCTAGGYGIPEGQVKVSQAKQYFNQYTDQGVKLYYFIKSDGDRYALAVMKDGDYEVYDKRDNRLPDIEEIPGIEDIEIDGLDIESMIGNGHLAICDNCGDNIRDEDDLYYSPESEPLCQSCFDDLCFWCENCGNTVWYDDAMRSPYGSNLCQSCFSDSYTECDECDEPCELENTVVVDGDRTICMDCFENGGYAFCDSCGEAYPYNDMHDMRREILCDDCFEDSYFTCDKCGAVYSNDESNQVDDIHLCDDCFAEELEDEDELDESTQNSTLLEDIAAVRKNYPKISDEDFDRVIRLDPTFVEGKDSVGTYGKWLLNIFNKGKLDNEGHAKDCLSRFEEEKKNLKNKDIGQFKSLEDVDAYLNDEENYKDKSHRQEVRDRQKDRKNSDLSKEADIVYKNNFWTVWAPNTYAAACKLGQGSSWCTASTESDHYYNYYTRQGPLLIVINNADEKEKYQFHFETASFMDANDEPINLIEFLRENEGLFDFFKQYLYDYIGLSEDDIVDGKITTSVYDKDDFRDIFDDNNYELIYSLIGAEGDNLEYFDYFNYDYDFVPEFDNLPDNIKAKLIELGISSSEELVSRVGADIELAQAFQHAGSLAEAYGAAEDARSAVLAAIEDAGGEYRNNEIYISVTEEELLDNFDDYFYDCQTYEDMLKEIFKDKFEIHDPYYGWSGFDEEVFYEELEYRLDEIGDN